MSDFLEKVTKPLVPRSCGKKRPVSMRLAAVGVAHLALCAASSARAQTAHQVCFRSPEDAVMAGGIAASGGSGYRLQARHWDSLLGRAWATIVSCEHPERPAIMLPTAGKEPVIRTLERRVSTASGLNIPQIRSGEPVRVLWKEELLQVEFFGVAQSNGNPGDQIRVRITYGAFEAQASERYVVAVVRGPHLLEMQP